MTMKSTACTGARSSRTKQFIADPQRSFGLPQHAAFVIIHPQEGQYPFPLVFKVFWPPAALAGKQCRLAGDEVYN